MATDTGTGIGSGVGIAYASERVDRTRTNGVGALVQHGLMPRTTTDVPSSIPGSPSIPVPAVAAADAVAILVFATVGRMSHAEGLTVAGVAQTAWPFLVGAALGWVVTSVLLRRPPLDYPGGVLVWVGTIAGGMTLRAVTGAGVALSFVVVASLVTGVLLLGWRALAARRRAVRRGSRESPTA